MDKSIIATEVTPTNTGLKYINFYFQITGYELIQTKNGGDTSDNRLYSVIYTMDDGGMVCTESRGADIQYPGETFHGLDPTSPARITVQVKGTVTDNSMTKRFFGQWLRFENGMKNLVENSQKREQAAPSSESSTDDSSDDESIVPRRRELQNDQLTIYETN